MSILKEFFKYIGALMLYLLLSFIGAFYSMFIILAITYTDFLESGSLAGIELTTLLENQPYYILALGISSLHALLIISIRYKEKFLTRNDLENKHLFKFFGLGVLFNLILAFVLSPMLSQEMIHQNNSSAQEIFIGNPIFVLITSAILVPIFEEFIFRYLMQNNKMSYLIKSKITKIPLQELENDKVCFVINAIIQSSIFGLMHGNPLQIAYTSVLGFIFTFYNKKYNSYMPSILMHCGLNFVGAFMSLFV